MWDIFKSLKSLKSLKQGIFPSYLGIDIGTTSIKAVEVKPGKSLPEVINYGLLESSGYLSRTNQALQANTLRIFEKEVAELLKLLVSEMKPKTNEALASLPVFSVFTTILDFPPMSPQDIEKSISFQARQYVPLPLSEVALDWIKVGEYKDDKGYEHQQILLISVPQDQIKKYQRIFEIAGLRLRALEIEGLSLARIFGGTDPTPTTIVDIGSRSTAVTFLEKGLVKFTEQSDFGGASLTQALATSLGINPLRAEELKKERGITREGPDYELSTIMMPFLDVIINEVKKIRYKYGNQFPAAPKTERLILSGGGANLLGVEEYFKREFDVPIVKAAPFEKFEYPPSMSGLIPELNPIMSVALGLVLREFA
ncbi:MAG: type IV pilus assembly protein PilM [Patescibacteria group bacterium]